ncbi:Ldh family oxidoreductase [Nocardioides zhouii]|uniref:Ldh family oxidoreductase n=1 Tax=Nocardioides zhouii TaxID=1168729 RepID=A0A4Q2SP08_9ACTN|nr:Ldh family oxidoreductase [Nocardioides zhouii]RYC05940.1 Ldh family oxidoreductase [Nocardioides zhouii]
MTATEVGQVRDWGTRVLCAVGVPVDAAAAVTESLIFADLRGVSTHGMLRLPTYVERLRAGGINARARVRVVSDLGALVVLDADAGPGASTGVEAADLAIERARLHGIGCVIARNANHFGASAYFTNRMADAGMVGLAACNTEPVMCAPFGGTPVLGTNPIAVAVPLPYDRRPQLDMATTVTSQGRLILALHAGEDIPTGWAVDTLGRPTTSAQAGLAGALLPVGGPKGFGLAFAVDALLALGGASTSTHVLPLSGDPSLAQGLGHLFLAVRADATGSLDDYRRDIEDLVSAVHGSAGDLDVPAPLVPGEPELGREQTANGLIELSPHVLGELRLLAAAVGIPFPIPPSGASAPALPDARAQQGGTP